jgi:hypothetical protein
MVPVVAASIVWLDRLLVVRMSSVREGGLAERQWRHDDVTLCVDEFLQSEGTR